MKTKIITSGVSYKRQLCCDNATVRYCYPGTNLWCSANDILEFDYVAGLRVCFPAAFFYARTSFGSRANRHTYAWHSRELPYRCWFAWCNSGEF